MSDGSDRSTDSSLERRLGLPSVTSLVVANMVGAGIFTTTGLLMADLPNPRLMLVLWAVGGGIALCGSLCYGELGAAVPEAGGEYAFLARIFHPLLGFLSGWVSLFAGFSAPIAASAVGCAAYVARAFPGRSPDGGEVRLGAVAVIVAFSLLHSRGLDLGARVQNVLTLLKVGLVLGLVAVGFLLGEGETSRFAAGDAMTLDLAGLSGAGLALMWIMFAYSGWNAAAYIGSEIRDPARNLPRGLLIGTLLVTGLYLALNAFYVWAVPVEAMAGEVSVAGVAVAAALGPGLDRVLSVLIGFALFSSLSAFLILGPRVYYAMARDGVFFSFAGRVGERTGVPSASVLLQGGLASLMVLVGTFDQILTYMGFALGIFPVVSVLGIVRLRRRGESVRPMPGWPWPAVVFVAGTVAILTLGFVERPAESGVAIGTVLAGIPAYLWFRRSRRDRP